MTSTIAAIAAVLVIAAALGAFAWWLTKDMPDDYRPSWDDNYEPGPVERREEDRR